MSDYLKNLTKEQYEAATQINGPMIVIAGPGTGKTQTISARIAYILEKTDAKPENILVLTFTDSGTVAVRKRLQSIIGNAAYYVSIYTFHAFAESIIETYKDHFGSLGNTIITDIDQITVMRKILDENNFERLKVVDDPYFYIRDIIRSISTIKREAVSPEKLKKLTEEEIEFIKTDTSSLNKRTGALKVDAQTKIKSLEKNFELAEIYAMYEKALREAKAHDYDDMIISVLNKIKNEEELKADLQERYQFFLVDEYQDTNGAQNQVVEQLAVNMYGDEPDLFVVGDDDQSIYRFQGASLQNILYFHKKFPNAKINVMTKSHRSTQKILDGAMSVIKNNKERLENKLQGINKNLFSELKDSDSKIVVADFDNARLEYLWIANKIEELVKKGYKYSDFAVFFRNNGEIPDFSNVLLAKDIPITSDKSSNILDDIDIRNLITLIRCIAEPYDDRFFYTVLCQPWSKVSPLDIVKLAQLRSKKKVSFFELAQDVDFLNKNNIGVLKKEEEKAEVQNQYSLFIESLEESQVENAVYNLANFLAKQNQTLNTETFIVFFDRLLKEIEFTDAILSKEDRIMKLNRLSTLFDHVKAKVQSGLNYSYEDFVNYISIIDEYNLTMPEKTLDMNTESVKIMTAHKSKGLEYKVVFIPKCVDRYWGNNQGRQNIALPENIVGDIKQTKDEKNEEERRLFYVAMTRAKSQIYISYSSKYESAYGVKESMPSIFLNEIDQNLIEIKHPEIEVTETDLVHEIKSFSPSDKQVGLMEDLKPEEKALIMSLVEDLKLNATALNNYLECPRKFYYNNLLRIPQLRSDKQSFGTAMHKALEIFYDTYNEESKLPSKEFLIEKFNESFAKEIVTKDGEDRLKIAGEKGLSGYYDKVITNFVEANNILYTELNFEKRNVVFEDIRITGKIDAIVQPKNIGNYNYASVVDYKTGRVRSRGEIEKFTVNTEQEMVPSGYYSQLMFYKILTDNDKSWKIPVQYGILDFIEGKDGKYKQEVFEYKEDELENFKQIIRETVKKIRNLEFNKIKKGKSCTKCPFTKICWGG